MGRLRRALVGIPTVTAENGKQALLAMCDDRPLLILLDLTMPVMDGWQFRAAPQRMPEREPAEVPVVILSAFFEADVGAVALVRKPGRPRSFSDGRPQLSRRDVITRLTVPADNASRPLMPSQGDHG